MSYYDFSSQRPKQQKSRALLVIGLTLTVIAIAAILFARHHKSRALHEAKKK
jgi:cell division protein FtsN